MIYFFVFLLSNLLEVPVYWGFLREQGLSFARSVLVVTAMNSLTHPIVFFVIMNFRLTYLWDILLAEAFAIVSEAWILRKVTGAGPGRAFGASVMANVVSWQLAPLITGWLALP